jgi:hypothetical protein
MVHGGVDVGLQQTDEHEGQQVLAGQPDAHGTGDSSQPTNEQAPAQVELWVELQELIGRAKKGDRSTLPRLREFLRDNSFLWRSAGDLSVEAQASWAKLACGDNLYLRECMTHQVNALKSELSGKAATPIEKMLVERVVTGMIQLAYLEAREAQQPEQQVRWAEYMRKRQDQAFRQYMTSLNALATLRRLVPQRTVYVPVAQPAVAQPDLGNLNANPDHVDGCRQAKGNINGNSRFADRLADSGSPQTEAAGDEAMSGVPHMNGHSHRLSQFLAPVGPGAG